MHSRKNGSGDARDTAEISIGGMLPPYRFPVGHIDVKTSGPAPGKHSAICSRLSRGLIVHDHGATSPFAPSEFLPNGMARHSTGYSPDEILARFYFFKAFPLKGPTLWGTKIFYSGVRMESVIAMLYEKGTAITYGLMGVFGLSDSDLPYGLRETRQPTTNLVSPLKDLKSV